MKILSGFLLMTAGLIMVLPAALSAAGFCNLAYGPGWHHGMFFGGGMFMWIFNILILGVVIYLAVRFFRYGSIGGKKDDTPIEILKKRLAKGEITKDEFETLKKDIL